MARDRGCTVKVNTAIFIPENQPEARRILRATICPVITRSVNIYQKVIFWGHIRVDLEYVAHSHTQSEPIFLVSSELPISHYIRSSKARPDTEAELFGSIEFQQMDLGSPRVIAVYILVNFKVVHIRQKQLIMKPAQYELLSPEVEYQSNQNSVKEGQVPMIPRRLGPSPWNRRH